MHICLNKIIYQVTLLFTKILLEKVLPTVYYPDNLIDSSGISFLNEFKLTEFQIQQTGIYLIVYDIKTNKSFNTNCYCFLINEDFNIINPLPPGSEIRVPGNYLSGFISFNRTFLCQLTGNNKYELWVHNEATTQTNLFILGGTNGPQILIIRVA